MEARLTNWNFQVSNMEDDHDHHHGNVLINPPLLWTSTFQPLHNRNLQLPPWASSAQMKLAPPPPPDDAEDDDEPEEELGAMKEMMYKIAAMQPVEIDPATIRKPKRRNVRISDDPQSVAARHRRERISEKIRILQRLVPGGTKMDTASMLDEAIRYVKFLRRQIRLLQSSNPPPQQQPHLPPPPLVTPPPSSKQSLPQLILVNNNSTSNNYNNMYQSALI